MAAKFKAQKRSDYKAPDFTAVNCELTFDLSDDATKVTSLVRYRRLCSDKKTPLILNGEELSLKNVSLDGGNCKYTQHEDTLVVEEVPDEFELQIENVIAPAQNSELMGLYKSDGCFCTQCEPEGFRRITYFLDRPDVLCRYKVTIIGPEYGCGVLLSNGNLIEKGVKRGRSYAVWEDPFPKPSYLFALVAGTFDIVRDRFTTKSGRNVDLRLYVDRGSYERGLFAMQCIKDAMKWDEERFDLEYDLDNFKVVAVDFFNQGAMENKSLNIFNSVYVMVDPELSTDMDFYDVQSVIGHEYFHNYTGDRVTLRDWFQLSLKESLTVFRDQEFSSDVASRTLSRLNAVSVIRTAQFAEDASPLAHPVRPEQVSEMNNFYTVTIYDKGAEVIRMIHTLIGEEKFKAGLADYLSKFDGQAATIEDFLVCMEHAGNLSLEQFRRWYSQSGTPEVTASWECDDAQGSLKLMFSQSCTGFDQKARDPFVIPVRMSFIDENGHRVVLQGENASGVSVINDETQTFSFLLDEKQKESGVKVSSLLPVLFEDFSAPVKFSCNYADEDLARMLRFSSDPFIKSDASVQLQNRYVHAMLSKPECEVPSKLIEAFKWVLSSRNDKSDPILISRILTVEPITAFMQTFKDVIPLDGLSKVRGTLKQMLASSLEQEFAKVYETVKAQSPKYSVADMGRRALNCLALNMLALSLKAKGIEKEASELVRNHYRNAKNMTDRLAAMKSAAELDLSCREEIFSQYEHMFGEHVLAMDLMFKVVAMVENEETVFSVRKLLRHPKFDLSNPNRVRALVGTLARSNPVALHRRDGAGYHLLSSLIRRLNDTNAMLAASLVTPLLSFKRFDEERAKLMREELEKLAGIPNLSRGLSEKIEAALK